MRVSRINLRAVLATDYSDEFRFQDYFATRFLLSLAVVFLVPLYMFAGGESAAVVAIGTGVSAMKFVEGIVEITHGQLQRAGRFGRIFNGLTLRSAVMVAVFAGAMSCEQNIGLAAGPTAILQALAISGTMVPIGCTRVMSMCCASWQRN